MTDSVAKGRILEIAYDYDGLARRAEERANDAARAKLNATDDE